MRETFRTVAALRSALSTRANLLLEILALRHQLGVLARSNRRFRPSDRLLWVCLRRWWPQWREALVLVQPTTVARWQHEGFRGWWTFRSRRRPGRPRIDVQLRGLIERMAMEKRSVGRATNPRRVAEARIHRVRTHCVPGSARPPHET